MSKTKKFIERHGLWSDEQQTAADKLRSEINDLEIGRASCRERVFRVV